MSWVDGMRWSGVLVGVVAFVGNDARAQSGESALAETLFQDGKKLMEAERYAEACPKLAESHKLDPSGGTILVLAVCYEKGGRTASAWAAYQEALAFSRHDHRDEREQRAKDRIAALEPKLARLTVRVSSEIGALPGLLVRRDGTALARAAWGVAVPVDAGEHVVEISADGRDSTVARTTVADGDQREIVAPLPSPKAAASVAPVAGPSRDESSSSRKTVGFVVLGGSVVALGVGTALGLRALSKQSDANRVCPDARCADPAAVSANDAARASAKIADVGFALGLIGAGVGTYLVLSTPTSSQSARRAWVTPSAGPTYGGVSAGGAW